jgi:hypothetical protein
MDGRPSSIKNFYNAELSSITRSSRIVRVHMIPINPCSVEITLDYNLLKCSLLSMEHMERKALLAVQSSSWFSILSSGSPTNMWKFFVCLEKKFQTSCGTQILLPCLQTHINWLYRKPDKSTYNLPSPLLNARLNPIFEPSLRLLSGLFPLGLLTKMVYATLTVPMCVKYLLLLIIIINVFLLLSPLLLL